MQCQLGERSQTLLDPFIRVPLHPSQLFSHSDVLPRQHGWRDGPRRSPCGAVPNPSPTTRSPRSRCAEVQAVDHVGISPHPDFRWSLHMRSAACFKNVITQALVPSQAFLDPLPMCAQDAAIPSPQVCVVKLGASKLSCSHPAACLQPSRLHTPGCHVLPLQPPFPSAETVPGTEEAKTEGEENHSWEFLVLLPEPPCPAKATSGPHASH